MLESLQEVAEAIGCVLRVKMEVANFEETNCFHFHPSNLLTAFHDPKFSLGWGRGGLKESLKVKRGEFSFQSRMMEVSGIKMVGMIG